MRAWETKRRIIIRDAVGPGLGILLTILSFSEPARCAADTPEKHLTIEEIVVTADAPSQPMATEVALKTIEQGKNINIPDVLKAEPDIDLTRRTLIGDTTDSLRMRGLSANRIMLNINGRPINAAGVVGGYYIDWSTIPLDNIEKIEIIRGGSSVRYGNNALGGVVNVITKKPTEEPTLAFFGTYGGGKGIDSIQNYRLTHTYKIGPLGYSLAGSYQRAAPFLWNSAFRGHNLAASIYLDMPLEGELTLGLQYANSDRGFIRENRLSTDPDDPDFDSRINSRYPLAFGETLNPYSGNAFIPGPGAKWDKTKLYLDFGYSQPIKRVLAELKIYKNLENRREKNYSSSYVDSSYADGVLVLDRKVESDRSYGASFELSTTLGNHELLAGVEYKVLTYGDTDVNYIDEAYNNWWEPVTGFPASSQSVCWGSFIQDTWRIGERLVLTGGLRLDNYRNKPINRSNSRELEDDAVTPKLTGTYTIAEGHALTAAVYQALRTPGLPETYWWAEGKTEGDPVLEPERNTAVELLYQYNLSRSDFVRVSTYYYHVDDYIVFRFDPIWKGAYNIEEAQLFGASVDARVAFAPWVSGTASVSWQRSRKTRDIYDTAGLSDEIDYFPEWKASAGAEFRLPYQAVANISLRYVGERRTVYAYRSWAGPPEQYFKLVKLEPYVTADIGLKIPVTQYGEISCYVENLFNKHYEEQFGYPMPGIIGGAALKIAF